MVEPQPAATQASAATEPPPSRLRSRGVRGLKMLLLVALLCFVARALRGQLVRIPWSEVHIEPRFFVLAMAVSAMACVLSVLSYWRMIGGFTPAPPLAAMCVVTWLPSLGKYVPGKFAAVAGAIWMLRQHGVPAAIGASTVMIQQVLAVLTGLMLALPLCFWQPVHDRFPVAWAWSIALLAAGVAALHPRILGGTLNLALGWLRREPLRQLPSLPQYAVPMLLLIVSWMVTGVATWLTARAIVPVSPDLLPLFAGANALAVSLGTLALVPGGIGVREGLLLLVLTPLTGPVASILVLVLRLQSTVMELLLAGVALLLLRRLNRPEAADGCNQAANS